MIEYDRQGRMRYNPELHDRQGLPWEEDEIEYLIRWYDIIGMEEMSLALGRTENTVTSKVQRMRKEGKMQKANVKKYTIKILKEEVNGKVILAY
ncbi:hypothetical protein ACQPUZ_04630 [Clostridium tertium]